MNWIILLTVATFLAGSGNINSNGPRRAESWVAPMTDQLKKSIEQLRTMTPKLNAATDEANKTVAAVEKFLNDECSIGISAYVNAWRGDSGSLRLAFDRIGGKFRIAVVDQKWIDDPQYPGNGSWQDVEVVAWSESPRAWKLRTFPALPALLEKIASEAEDAIKRIDQTQAAVQEIMGAI